MHPAATSNLFEPPELGSFRNAVAALIMVGPQRCLMQLRDDMPGIFYPGHWGLFGGAIDAGETPEQALRRELMEELGYEVETLEYFTSMEFGFDSIGGHKAVRAFYVVRMDPARVDSLVLTEGSALEAIDVREALSDRRVVPYDAFAMWLYHFQSAGHWSTGSTATPPSETETTRTEAISR